jgi:hypothetical protein
MLVAELIRQVGHSRQTPRAERPNQEWSLDSVGPISYMMADDSER